ncbi:MAG: DUF3667 domain-containing protein [Psychroflexus sp.]
MNCQHQLDISDRFCPECSQKNSSKKISFRDLLEELFASIFSYDSRLQRTLSTIFLSPGKITKEFIAGKRTKYVNPFRFFISVSIIFFLVFNWMESTEIAPIVMDGSVENEISERIDEESLDYSNLSFGKEPDRLLDFMRDHPQNAYENAQKTLGFEDTFSMKVYYNFLLGAFKLSQNPSAFLSYILPKLPFFFFFYIPVFTLLSWLIYIRRNFGYVDHLIFNYHQQSVFFIVVFVSLLIDYSFNLDTFVFALLGYAFYIYKALRRFYGQGRLKTFLKTTLLSLVYLVSSSLIIFSMIVLSLLFL